VTLVYQHELPNCPGKSIKGVFVEYGLFTCGKGGLGSYGIPVATSVRNAHRGGSKRAGRTI
jgi:hypothetical protein